MPYSSRLQTVTSTPLIKIALSYYVTSIFKSQKCCFTFFLHFLPRKYSITFTSAAILSKFLHHEAWKRTWNGHNPGFQATYVNTLLFGGSRFTVSYYWYYPFVDLGKCVFLPKADGQSTVESCFQAQATTSREVNSQ